MSDWGVGMPASVYLDEFASKVIDAFSGDDHFGVYHVGSSLTSKKWRDVDVRIILTDEAYAACGFGDPRDPHRSAKWVALVLAFSALGRQMTGLPIDFQIQQQTYANETNKGGRRSALGLLPWRFPNAAEQERSAPQERSAAQRDDDARELIVDLTVALENHLCPELADKGIDLRALNERALKWIELHAMQEGRNG